MTRIETNGRKRSGALFAAMLFAIMAIAAGGPGLFGPGAATHNPLDETIVLSLGIDCIIGNTAIDPDGVFWCGGPGGAELEIGPAGATADSGVLAAECAYRNIAIPILGVPGDETTINPGHPWTFIECSEIVTFVSSGDPDDLGDVGRYLFSFWVVTNDGNEHQEVFRFGVDTVRPASPLELASCADRYDQPFITACSSTTDTTGDVISPFGVPKFGSPLDWNECRFQGALVPCGSTQPANAHGTFVWLLRGADVLGNSVDRGHKVVIELLPPNAIADPTCSIFLSAAGWCRTQVTLGAKASALSGIKELECELSTFGDPLAGVDCALAVTADGVYDFRVRATSNVNRVSDWDQTTFFLDTTKPDGFFTSPAPGCSYILGEEICTGSNAQAVGVVAVEFFADDPAVNGIKSGMDRVQFRDNGHVIATIDAADSDNGWYRFDWDTSEAPSAGTSFDFGTRTLEARAYDDAGNERRVTVSINVPIPPVVPLP